MACGHRLQEKVPYTDSHLSIGTDVDFDFESAPLKCPVVLNARGFALLVQNLRSRSESKKQVLNFHLIDSNQIKKSNFD